MDGVVVVVVNVVNGVVKTSKGRRYCSSGVIVARLTSAASCARLSFQLCAPKYNLWDHIFDKNLEKNEFYDANVFF